MMKIRLIVFLLTLIALSCKKQDQDSIIDSENQSGKVIEKTPAPDSATGDTDSSNRDENDLQGFYKSNAQKPQLFLINNDKDTTILCKQKTRIKIKARCFVSSKNGKETTGKVQVSVNEYYNIPDILLANLSTTTNGKLLETGGMINITVSSGQEECKLKKGSTIDIEFPRTTEKEGMQLYTGSWKDSNINWQVLENTTDLNQVFTKVDQAAEFPGGQSKLYQFITRNIRIPDVPSGKILSSFTVDKEGDVTNVKVISGLGNAIDAEVVRVLKSLPKFAPARKNGVAVSMFYSLPIRIFASEENDLGASGKPTESFEKKYDTDEKLQRGNVKEINYYLFSSTELGYINCDRLWRDTTAPRIDYAIHLNSDGDANVTIVYHRYKSVMSFFVSDKSVSFDDIPSGEKISIVAVKYIHNQPFLAVKETETSAKGENDLVFQPVTMALLKSEMKKLDRFD